MKTTGKVTGIVSNLVTVEVNGPVSQNELCYITLGDTKLMAEVIKVNGKNAAVQVFESTRGLKNGNEVEFEDKMLEATLGPGLLSSSYDGLQNDLTTMTGVFLKRGEYTDPLNPEKLWDFTPIAKVGDKVIAADWLGEVKEGWLPHKIMVPFSFKGEGNRRTGERSRRRRACDNDTEMAGKNGHQGICGETPPLSHNGNRSACHRHTEPYCRRRYRFHSGTFRMWQDRPSTRNCKAG